MSRGEDRRPWPVGSPERLAWLISERHRLAGAEGDPDRLEPGPPRPAD